jgi:(p)ppGpp synthase/HD superfamily hydrolase
MIEFPTLFDKCLYIATQAHRGQKRKRSDQDYICHPARVAGKFIEEKTKCVAVLHDVFEDTPLTVKTLQENGVPSDVIDAVLILTKTKGESYLDYLMSVSGHPIARIVKIEDIRDNMADLEPCNLRDKYELALKFLIED